MVHTAYVCSFSLAYIVEYTWPEGPLELRPRVQDDRHVVFEATGLEPSEAKGLGQAAAADLVQDDRHVVSEATV